MSLTLLFSLLSVASLIVLAPQILDIILRFLPDSTGLPQGIHDALTFAVDKASGFNFIFPVDTMLQVLVFLFIFEVAMLVFKLVIRIIKLIRGTS